MIKKSCNNCILCKSTFKSYAFCGYHDKYFDLDRAQYCDDYECKFEDEDYANDILNDSIYNHLKYQGL